MADEIETDREEPPSGPYPCERCGSLVPAEGAFALMETLEVLCRECFQQVVRPCESCGKPVGPASYQHLRSGRVICEPCVISEIL